MTIDDIVKLIQTVSENGLTSFEYEENGQRLVLEKKKKKNVVISGIAGNGTNALSGIDVGSASLAGAAIVDEDEISPEKKEEPAKIDIGADKVVVSPLVGTFYCASSPDAEPFVHVGDSVKKGQVLGIIEAMKLMNEIESEFDGVIEAVLVGNEEVVEFGQPLFRIR